MVDPSMMDVIDHLLQCNDEELREVFYPSHSAEETFAHNQNKYGGPVVEQVGSPAVHDLNTLSLRELIEIERKLDKDSTREDKTTTSHNFIKSSTNFIGSGGNDNNSLQFNIDDIICGNESQDGEENVNFAVDSNDKVTSYMDCMKPGCSKNLQCYDNMMEVNLMDPPKINKLLSFTSTETDSTSTLPKNTSTECEGMFDFFRNENSETQTLNVAGIKRALPVESSADFESNIEVPNKVKLSACIEDCSSDSDVSITQKDEFEDLFADQKDEFEGITDRKEVRKMKNNKASRVHRAKKKQKCKQLIDQQADLEKRNAALKMQAESMEKEVSFLKELLLVKVAATPNT